MRIVHLITLCALVLSSAVFCTRQTIFTLSNEVSETVIVTEDLDTMRKIIETGTTRNYGALPLVELMATNKVFLVRSGTKVQMEEAHLFGRNARVHILEGEYQGRDGWVHKSMLH